MFDTDRVCLRHYTQCVFCLEWVWSVNGSQWGVRGASLSNTLGLSVNRLIQQVSPANQPPSSRASTPILTPANRARVDRAGPANVCLPVPLCLLPIVLVTAE